MTHGLDKYITSRSEKKVVYVNYPVHRFMFNELGNSKTANWKCIICGSEGKEKEKYRSTLRDRVRAHYTCRCKAILKELTR